MWRGAIPFVLAIAVAGAVAGLLAISGGADKGPPDAKLPLPAAAVPATADGQDSAASKPIVETPAESSVERALAKQVRLKFKETPLKNALAIVATTGEITILLDRKALKEAGLQDDTPITYSCEAIPLGESLRNLLADSDLDYLIEDDNVLLVTTKDADGHHTTCRVYDVHDLATPADEFTDAGPSLATLIDLIKSTIGPQTWSDAGGNGAIVPYHGTIIVSQSRELREQIAEAIPQLRRIRDEQLKAIEGAPRYVSLGPIEPKLRKILDKPQDFDFHEAPLTDVADSLRKRGIPIEIDKRALQESGVQLDTPISFKASRIRLGNALKLMLQQIDLDYVVDHGLILITDVSHSKEAVRTSIYPVADLVGDPTGKSPDEIDAAYDELSNAIQSAVAPQTWDDAGGAGAIAPFPLVRALVISQSVDIHEQIAQMLIKLRATRHDAKQPAPPPPASVARVYSLVAATNDDGHAAELIAAIRAVVEPKSWSTPDTLIARVPDGIVVRQSPAVQAKVKALLEELQMLQSPPSKKPAAKAGGPRVG